jgi:hypothetical protein
MPTTPHFLGKGSAGRKDPADSSEHASRARGVLARTVVIRHHSNQSVRSAASLTLRSEPAPYLAYPTARSGRNRLGISPRTLPPYNG